MCPIQKKITVYYNQFYMNNLLYPSLRIGLRVYFYCRLLNTQPDVFILSTEKRIHFCKVCNKIIEGKEDKFRRHKITHETKTLFCPICGDGYSRAWMLKYHIDRKHKPAKCQECDKSFSSKNALVAHVRFVHRKDERKKHSCTLCGKLLESQSTLREHKLIVHEGFMYKCQQCPKQYSRRIAFKEHQRTHASDYVGFKCEQCEKTFTSIHLLRKHMSVHDDSCKYMCEICGKGVTSASSLRAHKDRHTGNRRFTCPTCGKASRTHGALRVHIRTHTNEKPYSCSVCGKNFTQRCSLTVHTRSVHTKEKPYKCHLCEKCFVTKTLLKSHISKVHGTTLVEKLVTK